MYIIYGKDNCPFCEKAKALLTIKELPYTYLTLDKDFTRDELLDMAPNAKSFPQIWQEDELDGEVMQAHIGGYTDLEKHLKDEVEVLLDEGNTLKVTFTKVDGTTREILCTKNADLIYTLVDYKESTRKKASPEGVVAVFDLEKNDWRSFRLDSVQSYELVEEA